jgi:hypothetical protein
MSLLDNTNNVPQGDVSQSADKPKPEVNTSKPWAWSEDLPGTGDTPEWFIADKYKSVAEQAKGYKELSSKFGQFTGAPKDGYVLDKYKETVNIEDPTVKKFMESAKTMSMSQEGFEQVMDMFIEHESGSVIDPEKFAKELNTEERTSVNMTLNWVKSNLGEDALGAVEEVMLYNKGMISVLSKIRAMTNETKVPTGKPTTVASVADVQQLIRDNYNKYISDDSYNKKIDQMMRDALAYEGRI